MSSKSKKKPKIGKKKRKAKGAEKPPDESPMEIVKDEEPHPPDVDVKVPPPKPEIRPLNPVQALQYKFALLQEELVAEKKKIIELKRAMISKDEEIVTLKETVISREEQDLFKTSETLLSQLGVGESEEVLIKSGRLFVVPKGTGQKRTNG